MYRTSEEEREYQSLSRGRKARYDFEVSQDSTLLEKGIKILAEEVTKLYRGE